LFIAPDESRIVSANAEGLRALGLPQGACEGLPLDSAMPAIARLRQWRATTHNGGAAHAQQVDELVFWTNAGVVRLMCQLSDAGPYAGTRVVRVEPVAADMVGAAPDACQSSTAADDDTGHAGSNGATARPRTDEETLAAIARQIRQAAAAKLADQVWAASSTPASGGNGRPLSGGSGDGGAGGGGATKPKARVETNPEADDPSPAQAAVGAEKDVSRTAADPGRGGQARRALVRRIAHELKTPLSAIAAAAEIMKDERFGRIGDERYLRYAGDIHESARHALAVVERMLGPQVEAASVAEGSASDSAPAAAGRTMLDLEFAEIDLNETVAATLSTVEVLAQEAGLTLKADLADELPRIVADMTSLRQIVLNLVANAVKFTPRGGHVLVTTRAVVDGPLILEIADSGPGISEEDIRAIDQSDPLVEAVPRKGGGFGIGLPLVKVLATANGAELKIGRSALGGASVLLSFSKSRQILV